ncbi:hypothetical protein M011DRAFT_481551 [Sporormia fimetaria CBS 119925]|uniref:Uncharacterized protein n=1 Tax=Sporormia fimetaria CBS 119925 TaxID=1340428 RepID=A0A6A6UYQ4_9PLEO|nr:hypothetical protein M011DRAFT_481551 [Sporormia fimetaria CBS 119925]
MVQRTQDSRSAVLRYVATASQAQEHEAFSYHLHQDGTSDIATGPDVVDALNGGDSTRRRTEPFCTTGVRSAGGHVVVALGCVWNFEIWPLVTPEQAGVLRYGLSFRHDSIALISQTYKGICNSSDYHNVLLGYRGQFVVSAARIQGIGNAIYEGFHQAFVNGKGWTYGERYLQVREDSMSTPYDIERAGIRWFSASEEAFGIALLR